MGAGNSTAGNGIAGYGNIQTAPAVANQFLPDPLTGAIQDAPLLYVVSNEGGNPVLDIAYSPNMSLLGMSSIDQQVVLAIATIVGTAVNPNVGTNLFSIQTINQANYPALVTTEINNALATLVNVDAITIDDISVVVDANVSSRGNISLTYTNNSSGVQSKLSI
jgi:hypothetical protein